MIPSLLEELQQISRELKQSTSAAMIEAVSNSLQRDTFHLAVLGEFKRGKTTFVNSLIGSELLFTDILPATAVIHVLEYGDSERIEIHYNEGQTVELPLSQQSLAGLSASQQANPEAIRFVKVYLNHPLLRDGLVIIDTPGVNDLVRSRAEVTESILPHCDAALFLLDAVAPLTRSEAEFLEAKVFYYKLDQLLFVLSKSDRLDEDELEEAIEGAGHRVHQITGKPLPVYPYSPRSVLKHIEERQAGLHPQAQRMWDRINSLREASRSVRNKRNAERLSLAVDLLLEQTEWQQSLHQANGEQLAQLELQIDMLMQESAVRFDRLLTSIEQVGRQALQDMIAVSYDKLKDTAINDFRYDIRTRQSNMETMLERVIPLSLEQQLRRFSEVKASEISVFLQKLLIHIGQEYQKHFRLPLTQIAAQSGIPMPSWTADVSSDSRLQAQHVLKQVAPAAIGAAIGMVALPGIGIIIGGALGGAFSALSKNKQQESLRDEILMQLEPLVAEIVDAHHRETGLAINDWFDQMIDGLKAYHHEQFDTLKGMVQSAQRSPDLQSVHTGLPELLQLRDRLLAARDRLLIISN